MEEIWKPIKGYEDYYVSNYGQFKKKLKSGNYKFLKPWLNQCGYFMIGLSKNGKRKMELVSRVVAKTFIPNTENKTEVDHINTIRTDNRVENLRWVTKIENMNNPLSIKHMKDSGGHLKGRKFPERCGENHPMYGKHHSIESKLKMSEKKKGERPYEYKPIIQFTLDGDFVKEWKCIKDVENELNIYHSNLIACCKGRRKNAGGFIWKYKDDIKNVA